DCRQLRASEDRPEMPPRDVVREDRLAVQVHECGRCRANRPTLGEHPLAMPVQRAQSPGGQVDGSLRVQRLWFLNAAGVLQRLRYRHAAGGEIDVPPGERQGFTGPHSGIKDQHEQGPEAFFGAGPDECRRILRRENDDGRLLRLRAPDAAGRIRRNELRASRVIQSDGKRDADFPHAGRTNPVLEQLRVQGFHIGRPKSLDLHAADAGHDMLVDVNAVRLVRRRLDGRLDEFEPAGEPRFQRDARGVGKLAGVEAHLQFAQFRRGFRFRLTVGHAANPLPAMHAERDGADPEAIGPLVDGPFGTAAAGTCWHWKPRQNACSNALRLYASGAASYAFPSSTLAPSLAARGSRLAARYQPALTRRRASNNARLSTGLAELVRDRRENRRYSDCRERRRG